MVQNSQFSTNFLIPRNLAGNFPSADIECARNTIIQSNHSAQLRARHFQQKVFHNFEIIEFLSPLD